jgi:hypothetical protein
MRGGEVLSGWIRTAFGMQKLRSLDPRLAACHCPITHHRGELGEIQLVAFGENVSLRGMWKEGRLPR